MDDRCRVRGLTVLQCGLEANLFSGADCRVIQTVTQTANDLNHPQLAARFENHLEKYLTLYSLGPILIRVDGRWLGKDFRGYYFCWRRLRRSRLNGGGSRNIRAAKSRLLYATGRGSMGIAGSYAIAKSSAGDHSASAVRSSRSISIARAGGHIKAACLRDIHGLSLSGEGRYSVRITESPGLYMLWRTLNGLRRRASRRKHVRFDRPRNYRRTGDRNRGRFLGVDFDFRGGCVFHLWLRLRRRSGQTQRRGWRINRIEFRRQHRPRKLTLRRVIYRNWRRNQFDRVIVLLRRLLNLWLQTPEPTHFPDKAHQRPEAQDRPYLHRPSTL